MSVSWCKACSKEHNDWAWRNIGNGEWVCSKWFKPTGPSEDVPKEVFEERKEFFNSTLQPFRNGELSREYVEAHGTKGIGVTPEEAKKAKYVWKDLAGFSNRKLSK
jgi:hypothetical protein